MPRYFFHLNECGKTLADQEGVELPDEAAAWARAIREARSIMCAEIMEGRLCLGCSVEIHNSEGALLARVLFKDAVRISGAA